MLEGTRAKLLSALCQAAETAAHLRQGHPSGDELGHVLKHLCGAGHERARREPAAAIELDRHLDLRVGGQRLGQRSRGDFDAADQTAQVGASKFALHDRHQERP